MITSLDTEQYFENLLVENVLFSKSHTRMFIPPRGASTNANDAWFTNYYDLAPQGTRNWRRFERWRWRWRWRRKPTAVSHTSHAGGIYCRAVHASVRHRGRGSGLAQNFTSVSSLEGAEQLGADRWHWHVGLPLRWPVPLQSRRGYWLPKA